MASYDVITFDCYGTLVDWDEGIGSAFENAAAAAGVEIHRPAVLEAWARIEPQIQRGPYRRYRDVVAETAVRVARHWGWELGASERAFVADSLSRWKPFPDTNPALERLAAAGCRLAVLSNVDDDLFAWTRRTFTVELDWVVTAQQVGAYKPAEPHFLEARRRIGAARWLHAAQSRYHDIAPARALGIPSAWVNRRNETAAGGASPDYEVADLAALAALVCG
ncbi:MAG TPA: HAD family hydrolase [Thermoanaerobaculia bacterium]|nr:HAD family hydrolase [Thermoanaerobaculia bacterium]